MTTLPKVFVSHPVLDGYPAGTTFVYRSPNMYGGRAAARMNTDLIVFADKKFADKTEAYAYLENAGLIDICNEAIGSIILVTPIGDVYGTADAAAYYKLQTAIFAQKATGLDDKGSPVYYSEAEYFGGFGYTYVIGVEGGGECGAADGRGVGIAGEPELGERFGEFLPGAGCFLLDGIDIDGAEPGEGRP